ncbi:MAG: substrate-binding domain-containing protein [Deltaproteobacteria bacterium]|nr:substrate-binding domain-containing protein [Deltaproteobacteria bacterium]
MICLLSAGIVLNADADLRVVGSASNLELMRNLVIAFGAGTAIPVDLSGPGSLEGIHQLVLHKANLAYISSQLTEAQTASGIVGTPYCRDAVAVVVNPSNRKSDFTRAELKAIFTGNRNLWEDGNGVVVLIRDGYSGTRKYFEEKIIGEKDYIPAYVAVEKKGEGMLLTPPFTTFKPPFFPLIKSSQELLFSLSKIRGAIAYLSVGSIPKEARAVKIDGVAPTPENIKSGQYLLSRTPMLVTLGKPAGEARLFIDFILSSKGQKIIRHMGYIPIGD